MKNKHAKGPDG
jgi:hypothetical protein